MDSEQERGIKITSQNNAESCDQDEIDFIGSGISSTEIRAALMSAIKDTSMVVFITGNRVKLVNRPQSNEFVAVSGLGVSNDLIQKIIREHGHVKNMSNQTAFGISHFPTTPNNKYNKPNQPYEPFHSRKKKSKKSRRSI